MVEDESPGYRRFWVQLLDAARRRTDLHTRIRPGNDWWIGAMRNGISYNYALRKHAAYVELWIDKGSVEANEDIFAGLLAHKGQVEKAFGDHLVWHRAHGRGRAVQYFAGSHGFDDREHWPEIQKALIDAMIRLEAACSPYLNAVSPRALASALPSTIQAPPGERVQKPVTVWSAPVERSNAIVTMDNLKAGIAEFKRRWPGESDFNNRLYGEFGALRNSGHLKWGRLVDELSAWKALRTSRPGYTKDWYLARGEEPCRHMLLLASQIRSAHSGRDPDITETGPEELREMFGIAVGIKGAASPVFASKLCHFLMPSAFPVADQDMLGISTIDGYWQYWLRCALDWRASKEKEALKAQLHTAMSETPFPGYPWAVKIAELCHSGARTLRNRETAYPTSR
jgi:hypothetical protein